MKITTRQVFLTSLFITALIVANVITVKQFQLFGDFGMGCGFLTFPITFILSDLFSEVYGYRWSRIASLMAFTLNFFAVGIYQIAIAMPPANYYTMQEAFASILGATPRLVLASGITFLLADWIDDVVFRRMKRRHTDMTGFKGRAFWSSVVGEFVNAATFSPLAFYGIIPLKALLPTIITTFVLDLSFEFICLPITSFITRIVWEAESKERCITLR